MTSQREKHPASEPLKKSAQTANAVRGAIKTGKAIAGVAKGAAASGPYGAAAGFIWGHRKLIGKILIAAIVLLLLPILFLCMLPSLIFGGLINAFSPNDPNTPILNSSTVVNANLAETSDTVNAVLSEAMDDLLDEIDTDFQASGADHKEIINPYETPSFYADRFICQYCASKNQDFEAISLADMENTIRQNKDKLYSYTKTEEEREKTNTTDLSIIGEQTETTQAVAETWIIYTVVYNGEAYFADAVFHLTDEQKALAEDYAQNLHLFLAETVSSP